MAIVEESLLGGVCLNWGCIPTKALLRAAELKHNVSNLSEFGIEIEGSININIKNINTIFLSHENNKTNLILSNSMLKIVK